MRLLHTSHFIPIASAFQLHLNKRVLFDRSEAKNQIESNWIELIGIRRHRLVGWSESDVYVCTWVGLCKWIVCLFCFALFMLLFLGVCLSFVCRLFVVCFNCFNWVELNCKSESWTNKKAKFLLSLLLLTFFFMFIFLFCCVCCLLFMFLFYSMYNLNLLLRLLFFFRVEWVQLTEWVWLRGLQ